MEIARRLITQIFNTDLSRPNEMERFIEYVEDRKYNDKRYNISFQKLLALGWKQAVFIEDGLKKTIEYYRKKYIINSSHNTALRT